MAAAPGPSSPPQSAHQPQRSGTPCTQEPPCVDMEDSAQGNQKSHSTHQQIAQAVAALLSPTITAAVDRAVSTGILQLRKELGEHSQRLIEVEQRISSIEDDQYHMSADMEKYSQAQQHLHDRMEDLENRSRRNNLRIIGLPESYKPGSLLDLCTSIILEALGMNRRCTVERAHWIGAPFNDRKHPRPIIVKYLNCADRTDILQSFRKARSVMVEGYKLLIFADYSAEVSRKRKEFQSVCAELYKRSIRFTLAYPATLRLQALDGEQLTFQSPKKANAFLRSL